MIGMNEDLLGEARIQKGRISYQGATQKEDIQLMLMNVYPAPTLIITMKEVITPTPNILKMKVLPDQHLCQPTPMTHLPNEGIGRCFMAKGPKVSHHEYVDFNSDEDDLFGDDELLVDNYSDEYYDETNDNDKEKIESLTKELNTLKLAHETILGVH